MKLLRVTLTLTGITDVVSGVTYDGVPLKRVGEGEYIMAADERDEQEGWVQAELLQLIYQRIRDMHQPINHVGDCAFCGAAVDWNGGKHAEDCLWVEAQADDDSTEDEDDFDFPTKES